jgi:hypothetical protein
MSSGYQSKSQAFDSIVEELVIALKNKDFEKARNLTVTLRDTLPLKANIFFSADKQIQSAADTLSKIAVH